MENNQIVQTTGRTLNLFDPQTMEMALKATEMFTKSSLVPEMYREGGVIKKARIDYKTKQELEPAVKVSAEQAKANVFIALDLANRLQANPLMVMQNLYIVEGHPSWSSSFLISTVNTCGRFRPLKFYVTVEKNPDGTPQMVQPLDKDGHPAGQPIPNASCVAYTTERQDADEKKNQLTSAKITMQMAISEGWYGKNGSKWVTMPEQMLRYRAAAFWVRTYAPELANGMYTTEEVQDMKVEEVTYEEVIRQNANTSGQIAMHLEEAEQVAAEPQKKPEPEKVKTPRKTPAAEPQPQQNPMEAAAQQAENDWRNAAQKTAEEEGPQF